MTTTTSPTEIRSATNPLWGGRFAQGASSLLEEINSSVHFDKRLAVMDVAGSIAHARMLAAQGVISDEESVTIIGGLEAIAVEIADGAFVLDAALEDVHMNVEARLGEMVGPVAGRLHTGRSRNDQVAVDTKMWVREAIDSLDRRLHVLIDALIARATQHYADVMPGFTHMQCAQPVTVGHHLLAYAEMFFRDRDRFLDARRRLNVSPLGAAALAGTGYPIDPGLTASELGFDDVFRNSLDAVSDRDFILDYLSAGATLSIHLSRFAEELVTWSTQQFGFATLPEELTAGSSIMPQKRNPDAAELVRAKAGRVIGDLVALLVVMKALPLAYSRDMQEDKESLFDAADTLDVCARTMIAIVNGVTFFPQKMRADAQLGNTVATDLADWLVTEREVPFRESHGIVGGLVRHLEQRGLELKDTEPKDLAKYSHHFRDLPAEVLTVEYAVARRNSPGGTAPQRVLEAASRLSELNAQLAGHKQIQNGN